MPQEVASGHPDGPQPAKPQSAAGEAAEPALRLWEPPMDLPPFAGALRLPPPPLQSLSAASAPALASEPQSLSSAPPLPPLSLLRPPPTPPGAAHEGAAGSEAASAQWSEACSEPEALLDASARGATRPGQAAGARQGVDEEELPPPPPPPPPLALAVLCEGRRLESTEQDDLKGFRQRAKNSFFQALLDPEADNFKDSSGALVINGVSFALMEEVWKYLMQGVQPSLSTLSEYCEWRHVCDFFALTVQDPFADVRRSGGSSELQASALATNRYLMVKSVYSAGGLSPLCYRLSCGSACGLEAVPLGFDQVCKEGTLHLKAERGDPPLEVRLEPSDGSMLIRFMQEALWQHMGGHACLQHKRMVALKVRFPRPRTYNHEEPPSELQVAELYIHMRPAGKGGASTAACDDVCVASWPSFWCLVRIVRRRALGHSAWSSWNATFEILPGAVCVMADDLVVQVVTQPRSLHKCYIRVCGSDWEHEVCAKLLAPTPFYTHHGGNGKGWKGKALGHPWARKGLGPTLEGGKKYYKYQVPSYDTPTPEDAAKNVADRCMQQVWIIRRRNRPGAQPHLVVLLHAADGRVAVAQLSGDTGCIPPLYGVGGMSGRSSKTCAIWGAKAWHWGHQDVVGAIGQYSRSYDVPKCHEVMGMALQDECRILVLHRPRSRGSPQLWTISQPEAAYQGGTSTASFFRVHGKGKGTGGKGGKGNSIGLPVGGSWLDNRWGTMNQRQVVLPEDIVRGLDADTTSSVADCPLLVPVWTGGEASAAPEVEVLRLDGKTEVSERQAPTHVQRGRGGGGLREVVPQASWHITGRLHYRCREPSLPN